MRCCLGIVLLLSLSLCNFPFAQASVQVSGSAGQTVAPAEAKPEPAGEKPEASPQSSGVPAPSAPAGASAQASASKPSAAQTAPDFSKEAVVIERMALTFTFEKDGTSTRELTLSARVMSQAGVQALGVLTFPYLSSNENVEFDYVRVRKPDGSVVVTPPYNVLEMPAEVTRTAPMYSDIHEKHVTVKALGVGDVLEYVVRYRAFKPQVQGQFWLEFSFPKDSIARDYRLEVSVPRDKYVKVKSPDYKPEIREEGDRRIYVWKTAILEVKAPEQRREGPIPDIELTTFRGWDEVGRWYNELQTPQLALTTQLQVKAAELTKGLSSEDEEIRAIYDFVSSHFHYVSLSFGVGRYQPHAAAEVLDNEYGDCKDKHTLLAALLGAAGIESWPAAINATRRVDPDMPSPGQFDHVITYVSRAGSPLWLDTTPEVAPMGLLMSNLRDKLALVVPRDRPAELKRTPANPPFPTLFTFDIQGTLSSDGTLTAHVREKLRGDNEVLYRLGFRSVAPAHWQELMQNISNSEGFGGEVSNVSASVPEDTQQPFEISYDYTRKNYSDWDRAQIIAPFPPMGVEGAATQEKPPTEPVFLGAPGEVVFTGKIELPLRTTKMPGNFSYTEPWADFQAQYKNDGLALTIERRLKIKESQVPLTEWRSYKAFSKAVADDWGAWIELYNLNGGKIAAAPGTIPTFDPLSEEKKKEAWRAFENNDTATAENLLHELLKRNPKTEGAHAMLGYVYARRNDSAEAVEEFRKEEEINPNNTDMYRDLGRYYMFHKDYDKAEEQYRDWLIVDPKNYDATLALSGALNLQKKYGDAVVLWEQASKAMPDRSDVGISLGVAYIRNEQLDKALPLLEKNLTSDTRPLVLNDVAYELADMNTNLDEAKTWGDAGLQGVQAESLKTDSDTAALNSTRSLGAIWDTVGWIYFRRGELDKGERYLRAAFALTQDSIVGDHLAQLQEKQGKKEQAAHTYLLAIAAPDRNDKSEIRARYAKLTGKQAGNSVFPPPQTQHGSTAKASAPPTAYFPEEELSRARLYPIHASNPPHGSATFAVIFSPGKIEEVKFVKGDAALQSLGGAIKDSSMRADFPNSDPVHLMRYGIADCHSTSCSITLLPTDTVQATE